ncbi:hypothetical protein F2P81_017247 [Scophthalmus maximus]|uniref:Uncharacterized protein n=1 Tax=Scophthalmus maximus TaxID=52904 RepID=A0A6A4S5M7_SCOMX|nr:hypothetical protein F2P81_017247 [Scophthalmus maximus]
MKVDGVDVSVCAAALHIGKDPSLGGRYHRLTLCFLVSCFSDWICNSGTEWHQRGKSMEMSKCNREIAENQCVLSEKRGHQTSVRGLTICLQTRTHTKNSLGLSCNVPAGAACHYGYDFRFKHCASSGGANPNVADKRAGRIGLNLHFILVVLFSTNKLTPEKT